MSQPVRVVVWGENFHELHDEPVRKIYPEGMHAAIAQGISELLGESVEVSTTTLLDDHQGITEELLASTDVLVWWGHARHDEVTDETAALVQRAVQAGMGLLVLHSGHHSKPFVRLMGTTCNLDWRGSDDRELVWTVNPGHPIAHGVPHPIIIEAEEMYGEPFDIPQPDELIFVSSFSGGEVIRSGATWTRGRGRVFYFRPGDQEYPTYFHPDVRRVIANAVGWLAPVNGRQAPVVNRRPAGWFQTGEQLEAADPRLQHG